ncbi:hypothetical protein F5884DRAFT_250816 [Xylogone sp. PMI_703]|nr:hypothetical protein F5884DRAFT_250816 [Xylogone sp. PMI_703]
MFIHFPNLPTEIRLQIWHNALANARIIGIKIENLGTEGSHFLLPTPTTTTIIDTPVLQVNRESRTQALQVLQLLRRDTARQHVPNIYINTRLDTVWFAATGSAYNAFYYFLKHGFVATVTNIAVPFSTWTILYDGIRAAEDVDKVWQRRPRDALTLMFHMQRMHSLGVRELCIVVNDEEGIENGDVVFVVPRESPLEMGISKNMNFTDWTVMACAMVETPEEERESRMRLLRLMEGNESQDP